MITVVTHPQEALVVGVEATAHQARRDPTA